VLVAALTVDSIGNGLFAPLSLVYFVRLTDVPLPLVGVLLTAANLVALPLPVWAGTWPTASDRGTWWWRPRRRWRWASSRSPG
jgi:hypothetical protein